MDLMSTEFEKSEFIEVVQNQLSDIFIQAELEARKYGKIGLNVGLLGTKKPMT